jgi:hypothetical protein
MNQNPQDVKQGELTKDQQKELAALLRDLAKVMDVSLYELLRRIRKAGRR